VCFAGVHERAPHPARYARVPDIPVRDPGFASSLRCKQ